MSMDLGQLRPPVRRPLRTRLAAQDHRLVVSAPRQLVAEGSAVVSRLLTGQLGFLPTAVAWNGGRDEETYVYRAFNANGDLLYVGMTRCVISRLASHVRDGSPWIPEVADVHWELYSSRAEAARVERMYAKSDPPPLYNLYLVHP